MLTTPAAEGSANKWMTEGRFNVPARLVPQKPLEVRAISEVTKRFRVGAMEEKQVLMVTSKRVQKCKEDAKVKASAKAVVKVKVKRVKEVVVHGLVVIVAKWKFPFSLHPKRNLESSTRERKRQFRKNKRQRKEKRESKS
jgi:hypothetical protein